MISSGSCGVHRIDIVFHRKPLTLPPGISGRGKEQNMKIVPNKNVFRGTYYELCPGFEVKEQFRKKEEMPCECKWCKNAEYHSGADAADGIGGCICQRGYDVRKTGEYPVKLREQE